MEVISLVGDSGIVNVKNDNFEWVSKTWNGKNGLLLQMVSIIGYYQNSWRIPIGETKSLWKYFGFSDKIPTVEIDKYQWKRYSILLNFIFLIFRFFGVEFFKWSRFNVNNSSQNSKNVSPNCEHLKFPAHLSWMTCCWEKSSNLSICNPDKLLNQKCL